MGLKFSSLFRRLPGSTRSSSAIRLRITASKWDNSLPNRSGNSLWRNPSKKTRRKTRLKIESMEEKKENKLGEIPKLYLTFMKWAVFVLIWAKKMIYVFSTVFSDGVIYFVVNFRLVRCVRL